MMTDERSLKHIVVAATSQDQARAHDMMTDERSLKLALIVLRQWAFKMGARHDDRREVIEFWLGDQSFIKSRFAQFHQDLLNRLCGYKAGWCGWIHGPQCLRLFLWYRREQDR